MLRPAPAALAAALVLSRSVSGAESPAVVTVYHDASARAVVLDVGPLDLPAHAGHDVAQPRPQRVALPVAGYLRSFEVELVDESGRRVPQRVLHHVNVIFAERREWFSRIRQRLMAAGEETAPLALPWGLGVRVRQGEPLIVMAMVHNPLPEDFRGVHLRVRFTYTPDGGWPEPIAVQPFYLDVSPPAGKHAYDLPPGRSQRSWEGRPAVAGRVLGVGGHVHEYAKELVLEDVTRGKVLWRARPELGEDGKVRGMPRKTWLWRLGLKLRPDHTYRLTAIYENPTGRTIPDGAMGALGGIMVPADGARWPPLEPAHPEALADEEFLSRTPGSDPAGGARGSPGEGHEAH